MYPKLFLIKLILVQSACMTLPDQPRYSPSSEKMDFDFSASKPFSLYVQESRDYLKSHRVFF